jgi:hypothetical protein
MIEKIYDTIKAILYTDFPKNSQGYPVIYDRVITDWLFGDREITPAPLGVILRNTHSNIKDIGFGLREIEYSIGISFYASGDNKETSERVVQEAARVAHQILKNHRSMWVCDLCPFCGQFPLSPIHYTDIGVVTGVGINTALLPSGSNYYLVTIPGTTGNAIIKLSQGISGNVTVSEILSCGLGVTATSYSDSYATLSLKLSGGTPHTGYSTTAINNYVTNVLNQGNTFWAETHTSSSPPYYDWAGVSYQAVQEFISDWQAGIKPSGITGNLTWNTNINNAVANDAQLMRLLQDIQVSEVKPSDDGIDKALYHTAEFTMRGKEVISVDVFGPNNVNVNAI